MQFDGDESKNKKLLALDKTKDLGKMRYEI